MENIIREGCYYECECVAPNARSAGSSDRNGCRHGVLLQRLVDDGETVAALVSLRGSGEGGSVGELFIGVEESEEESGRHGNDSNCGPLSESFAEGDFTTGQSLTPINYGPLIIPYG